MFSNLLDADSISIHHFLGMVGQSGLSLQGIFIFLLLMRIFPTFILFYFLEDEEDEDPTEPWSKPRVPSPVSGTIRFSSPALSPSELTIPWTLPR